MGAQGAVIDADNRILLVRHTYRPGWHFPGGGVEKNETVLDALTRELREETGVIIEGSPELLGIYANFKHFPSDHVVVYIVRNWQRPHIPSPNREIAEHAFFDTSNLPDEIYGPTHRRIGEILHGTPRAAMW